MNTGGGVRRPEYLYWDTIFIGTFVQKEKLNTKGKRFVEEKARCYFLREL